MSFVLSTSKDDNDWTTNQELLVKSWVDKARCYSWMHNRSSKKYRKLHYLLTIPSILLSAISGSANFMVSGNGGTYETTVTLGCINLFTAMLMSINQFLKLPEYTDRHKNAANGYSKFLRNINMQLSLDKSDREPGLQFISNCKKDFDTLSEQSPYIPDNIISEFKKEFANSGLEFPDIVNIEDSDNISINI